MFVGGSIEVGPQCLAEYEMSITDGAALEVALVLSSCIVGVRT